MNSLLYSQQTKIHPENPSFSSSQKNVILNLALRQVHKLKTKSRSDRKTLSQKGRETQCFSYVGTLRLECKPDFFRDSAHPHDESGRLARPLLQPNPR